MSKRDKVLRRYKRFPTDENWSLYKKLRNRCSRMCRDAKRHHIHNSVQNFNSPQVWQFLRSIGIGKVSNENNPVMDLEALNMHFSKVPVTMDVNTKFSTLKSLSELPLPMCTSFSFKPVTEQDIKKYILSISTKAVGTDGIQIQMLIPILEVLAPVICHIINFSLETSTFPQAWKKPTFYPYPKFLIHLQYLSSDQYPYSRFFLRYLRVLFGINCLVIFSPIVC